MNIGAEILTPKKLFESCLPHITFEVTKNGKFIMAFDIQFASKRSPFKTFFSMFILRYNFYLGKFFKGLIQWAMFISMIALFYTELRNGNIKSESNNEYSSSYYKPYHKDEPIQDLIKWYEDFEKLPKNQAIMTVLFYILFFWVIRDVYLLFSGKLKDGEGKLITFRSGCSNCGFLGEMQTSREIIDSKKVKVKVEKVIAKNYDKFGKYIGSTKGVTEEEKLRRTIKVYTECPECGHKSEDIEIY